MTALTVEQVECWRRAFQMNIETGELHPDALKLCDLALAALTGSRAECERLNKELQSASIDYRGCMLDRAEYLRRMREAEAECERLRLRCVDEIRLRSEAATRAIAAETECERLRRDAEVAHRQLMNVQPHIAQLPERYRPFIDSHVDEAMRALSASAEKEQQ